MLMPRKVRHRKQQRGRLTGAAKGGTDVTFGAVSLLEDATDLQTLWQHIYRQRRKLWKL